MPRYEFFCRNCKKLFSRLLSLVDYERGTSSARTVAARKSSSAGLRFPRSRRRRAPEIVSTEFAYAF